MAEKPSPKTGKATPRRGLPPKGNFAFISKSQKAWVRMIPVADNYSVRETAQILGIYESNVYRFISTGVLNPRMIEGSVRLLHNEVVRYITETRQELEARATKRAAKAKRR